MQWLPWGVVSPHGPPLLLPWQSHHSETPLAPRSFRVQHEHDALLQHHHPRLACRAAEQQEGVGEVRGKTSPHHAHQGTRNGHLPGKTSQSSSSSRTEGAIDTGTATHSPDEDLNGGSDVVNRAAIQAPIHVSAQHDHLDEYSSTIMWRH